MSNGTIRYTGGCLCGGLRHEASGEPLFAGFCYCGDCRKASGAGCIPFIGFPSSAVRFTGAIRSFASKAANGGDAVRNFCPVCGGLVFGGVVGKDDTHTVYAGSLDDPSAFRPSVAIFTRNRPAWATIPDGLTGFDGLPPV
ncbi:MAG: GFA family protein [Acetobacteraceae bacterium]